MAPPVWLREAVDRVTHLEVGMPEVHRAGALARPSAGRDQRAKGWQGRLRALGWSACLVVVSALIIETINSGHNLRMSWQIVVAIAAVCVVLVRPRLAASLLPVFMIGYGLDGIDLVHGRIPFVYGLVRDGGFQGPSPATFVLLEAYAFLLLGGYLAWRELSYHPAAAQLVLGRMAATDRPGQLWGLALLPAAIIAGALVSSNAALIVTGVLLTGAMVVIRRSPDLAARLATVALIGIGLAGLLVAKTGSEVSMQAAPGGPPGVPSLQPGAVRFGLIALSAAPYARLVLVEAVVLLGLGCWLAPRTFPSVGRLLRMSPDAQLAKRLQRLTESRAVAVDTAAADLRRLERDLHDGAQARLVALGMNLRAAEKLIHTSPDAAAALVTEARETSARALTELRELVRGVHPPVLADRGLADAVRALALDSPLSVETEVDLAGRPPAPVETACYFAIAELLTNAAKHSGGRSARVVISHDDGLLRIEVTDFGLGGADPARGSGLAGVEKRLAGFDGILAISSPVGGPTIVVLEVPCVLSLPKISSC